jgi:hypothetical protein
MPQFNRRRFLQAAGTTLATIGLSQFDFLQRAHRYGRVLAQDTPRKLALLVGINQYETASSLNGCLNDVEMQRELLIHRYGFSPRDIVEVWDNASSLDLRPTRDNILRAFQEHLGQARSGDVVVFHFSGHGSRVIDPTPMDSDACRDAKDCHLNGTLVPNDPIASSSEDTQITVKDIMGRSLFLLTRALEADNVIMVLDSCHSGAGTRGNTVVRAIVRENQGTFVSSPEEAEMQQRLMTDLRLSQNDFEDARRAGIARGIAIGSARREQLALDYRFDGFHAGAFSYLLTRYLWQLPGSEAASTTYVNLSRSTKSLAERQSHSQDPIIEYEPDSNNEEKPLYFADPVRPTAEAVITDITGSQIALWLGGVSSQNIGSADTVFTVLDNNGDVIVQADGTPLQIQQSGRSGLAATGQVLNGDPSLLQVGQLLREQIVGIPLNPRLTLGLDPSLGNEIEAARTALETALIANTVNRLDVVDVDPTAEVSLDYILGKATEELLTQLTDAGETDLPPIDTIGLLTPSLSPLTGTFGRVNESAIAAVNRLRSQFRLFLVGQVLSSIATTHSSLNIQGNVISDNGTSVPLSSRQIQSDGFQSVSVAAEPFRAGEAIQVQIDNQEDRDMYLSCLAIDGSGNLITLYPVDFESPEEASRIARNDRLTVPRPEDEIRFAVGGSGYVQLITLVSTQPLRIVLQGLEDIARSRGVSRSFIQLQDDEPLRIMNGLLADVDVLTRSGRNTATIELESTSGQSPLDTEVLAAFSTMIEIREE